MTGSKRAGFPSFFPTNDAVAFHYQVANSNHEFNTWHGAQAQIWWSDLATGTASSLNALNGLEPDGMTSYLPVSPYTCHKRVTCPARDAPPARLPTTRRSTTSPP